MCQTPNPIGQRMSSISLLAVVELGIINIVSLQQNNGFLIDNGEFLMSIGAFTTFPKAPHGKIINHTTSKFFDIVHLDLTLLLVTACPSVDSNMT